MVQFRPWAPLKPSAIESASRHGEGPLSVTPRGGGHTEIRTVSLGVAENVAAAHPPSFVRELRRCSTSPPSRTAGTRTSDALATRQPLAESTPALQPSVWRGARRSRTGRLRTAATHYVPSGGSKRERKSASIRCVSLGCTRTCSRQIHSDMVGAEGRAIAPPREPPSLPPR